MAQRGVLAPGLLASDSAGIVDMDSCMHLLFI